MHQHLSLMVRHRLVPALSLLNKCINMIIGSWSDGLRYSIHRTDRHGLTTKSHTTRTRIVLSFWRDWGLTQNFPEILCTFSHITILSRSLYWLPVAARNSLFTLMRASKLKTYQFPPSSNTFNNPCPHHVSFKHLRLDSTHNPSRYWVNTLICAWMNFS